MNIIIIDSSYLTYKSFFAFVNNHLSVIKDGEEIITSAIFGFIREILALSNYGYENIICVWDTPPYLKKDRFKTYKEKRKHDIPSLHNEREMIKGILYDLHIPSIFSKGYEGEDVASYIMNKIGYRTEEGTNTNRIFFYTNDEDCYALLSPDTQLINTVFNRKLKRSELTFFSTEDLKKKYGVTPKQFSIMKAIMGCQSDNVQGVRGIGPKTSSELAVKYKNVKNIYQNLSQLRPKVAEKLIAAKENGLLFESMILTKITPPTSVELYRPPIKLQFEQILGYIEANTLLRGANRLQLTKLREKNIPKLKKWQEIIKWSK